MALVAVTSSCDSGGSGSSTGTDTSTSGGAGCKVATTYTYCMSYGDVPAADVQSGCTTLGGTVVSACPTTNELGTCVATLDGIATTTIYYSGGTLTAAEASIACGILGGTWTAS